METKVTRSDKIYLLLFVVAMLLYFWIDGQYPSTLVTNRF